MLRLVVMQIPTGEHDWIGRTRLFMCNRTEAVHSPLALFDKDLFLGKRPRWCREIVRGLHWSQLHGSPISVYCYFIPTGAHRYFVPPSEELASLFENTTSLPHISLFVRSSTGYQALLNQPKA